MALANDMDDRFLTVVIADGSPTVFSEEAYNDRAKWNLAIDEAVQNSSINRLYLPEDLDNRQVGLENPKGNICWYTAAELSVPPGIRPVYGRNRYKHVIAGAALMVVSGIAAAVGWFIQEQDLLPREAAEVSQTEDLNAEVSRLDIDPIIDHCIETLGEFWPMAPEWTLIEEGCVMDPEQLPRSLPDIQMSNAFSFRLYRLIGQWNEFLAGHAAERITREFDGSIHRDASSIVLYREIIPSRRIVERGFKPETDIAFALDRLFVGNIEIEDGATSRRDLIEASTALEVLAALNRMNGSTLETVSVSGTFDGGTTKMRVRPVRLQTERTSRTKRPGDGDE